MTSDEILKNGSKIFSQIFKEFEEKEIVDLRDLDRFLKLLLQETKGLIILDFLDAGNWDCLGSYEIDYKNEFLILNWQTLTTDPNFEVYKKTNYKPSISTILIHFKDLKLVELKNFPFAVLRGYSFKTTDVLNYYKKKGFLIEKIKYKRRNFSTEFTIDKNTFIEDCDCYDTPIYSIMILPKDSAGSASFSTKMLFAFNYDNCIERLSRIASVFTKKNMTEDEICEKSNTIRRIFESMLKIECCYQREFNMDALWTDKIDSDHFIFRSDYSDALLGELIKILKIIKTEDEVKEMNKIVRLSNELSHDSGKKVTYSKAKELLDLTWNYCQKIMKAIKF